MRNGDWMQTYTGKKFWPFDARPEDISIFDIAHALSNLCRYGGHSKKFYSVAEHSILISQAVPKEYALWGLLHDAAEAYLQDIIRPLKSALPDYKTIENNLMEVIIKRFKLLPVVCPASVTIADVRILNDEHIQAMGGNFKWYHDSKIPLEVNIQFWNPEKAEFEFLKRMNGLY